MMFDQTDPWKEIFPINHLFFKNFRTWKSAIAHISFLHQRGKDYREREWLGQLYKPYILQGKVIPSEVRWISSEVGYGLFATHSIVKGGFIGEYVGQVEKTHPFSHSQNDYLAEYSCARGISSPYVVNAERFGNATRWINHSETPNLAVRTAYVAPLVHLIFIAERSIVAGEQLTFDYGPDYWEKDSIIIKL